MPGNDPTLVLRKQLFARIVGDLGGRAAEEIIFGEDNGCSEGLAADNTDSETNGDVVWDVGDRAVGDDGSTGAKRRCGA